VVWCGVVWCGVVWCGVVWCHEKWYRVGVSIHLQHVYVRLALRRRDADHVVELCQDGAALGAQPQADVRCDL
jgi:hypothetical protein